MILRRNHLSVTSGGSGSGETDGDWIEVNSTETVDHWAFLDEIEAPMWADLNSEANCTYQEIDDDWFHISHPVHQCSSSQLKSSVYNSAEEGCTSLTVSMQGPPSPKLPTSVSRSRGKHCKSKEWEWRECKVTLSKQHPVKNLISKSSLVNSETGKEVKPMFAISKLKEDEGSDVYSVCESCLTDTAGSSSSFGTSKPHLNPLAHQGGNSSSINTATSVAGEQQQRKCLELSSQIPRQTSGLLSSLRISVRRSCGTRQPSRVEVNGERKSEGGKSSSSKSSVGSSLCPGYDGKNPTLGQTQNKDKTPESRNAVRVSQAPRNKLKLPNVSKVPAVQFRDLSCNSRLGSMASKELAKAKVEKDRRFISQAEKHTLRAKVLMSHNINDGDKLIARKDKVKVGVNRKCNTGSGMMAVNIKSKTRDKAVGCTDHVQKALNQVVPRNDGKRLVNPKVKTTGQTQGKETTNLVHKVYFR